MGGATGRGDRPQRPPRPLRFQDPAALQSARSPRPRPLLVAYVAHAGRSGAERHGPTSRAVTRAQRCLISNLSSSYRGDEAEIEESPVHDPSPGLASIRSGVSRQVPEGHERAAPTPWSATPPD